MMSSVCVGGAVIMSSEGGVAMNGDADRLRSRESASECNVIADTQLLDARR